MGAGDAFDAIVHRTAERLPNRVKRSLSGPYNRILEYRADGAFGERSIEPHVVADDAPRHVLVVVVDAFRADAIDPSVCPFLDARTAGAAVTPSPWTFPAVTSILTGRYPHEHGSMRQSDEADRSATDLVVPPKLPLDVPALPDVFAGAGYATYGGFGFHMPFFALSGRFERHALYDRADAETVLDGYLTWLDQRDPGRSFAYLHLCDLHEPVDPPAAYWRAHDVDGSIPDIRRWRFEGDPDPGVDRAAEAARYRRHRRRLYDAALEYVDDQLRGFHENVGERFGDDVVLVATGDHGEAFWEHSAFDAARFVDSRPAYGVDHGGTPYEAIARVPLAVDGLSLADVDDVLHPASLVDVAPTLLDAVGLPGATDASGHSLVEGVPIDRIPIVEAARYGHEKKAAYFDGWKLLVSRADDQAVGFALPEEEPSDLPESVERALRDALPPWPDGSRADVAVSGLARDRLEDLGYV